MCIVLFSLLTTPLNKCKLIVAHNRDEFFDRLTKRVHLWNVPGKKIYSPRDLQSGGTWIGVDANSHRVSFLTNFREVDIYKLKEDEINKIKTSSLRSRGNLVKDFLLGDMSTMVYLKKVMELQHEYAGFNLVVWDGKDLGFYSNRGDDDDHQQQQPRLLEQGTYALSNGTFHSEWFKVVHGREKLEHLLFNTPLLHSNPKTKEVSSDNTNDEMLIEELMKLMDDRCNELNLYGDCCSSNKSMANNINLPQQLIASSTENDSQTSQVNPRSSIFVDEHRLPLPCGEMYGTRTCISFILNSTGESILVEKDLNMVSKEREIAKYSLTP